VRRDDLVQQQRVRVGGGQRLAVGQQRGQRRAIMDG